MSVLWPQGKCRAGTCSSALEKGEEGFIDGTSELKLEKSKNRSLKGLSAAGPLILNV